MRDVNYFRGCLLGGAAGDALGYAVEFLGDDAIRTRYGEQGITEYSLQAGRALISDDTQMTLFTANALLTAAALGRTQKYAFYIHRAYQDWLRTQSGEGVEPEETMFFHSWLFRVPDLNNPRAPGTTCLNALMSGKMGTLEKPINTSKGCGGVMRVAPIGLYFRPEHGLNEAEIDRIGAEAAAITHGHDLGWIPAAMLVRMIHEIIYKPHDTLSEIVAESLQAVCTEFAQTKHIALFKDLIEKAVELAQDDLPDPEAIRMLGEGWVAEETLAIAVYCALKHEYDFDAALLAAVNHSGDSDSTGAVTGNILGAWLGVEAIPEKYMEKLELRDVITVMADDLYRDMPASENLYVEEPVWCAKYVYNNYMMN